MLTLVSAGPGIFYLAMAAAAVNHGAQPLPPRGVPVAAARQAMPACNRACRTVPASELARALHSDLHAPGD